MDCTELYRPLFSVCIPNYNYGLFLKQCVESALNQTFKDYEIIVSDNCSTDDSKNIMIHYAKTNQNLRVLFSDKNASYAENWNKAMFKAKGMYLKLLHSDDVLYPWYLQTIKDGIDLYPEAHTIITQKDIFKNDEELKSLFKHKKEGKWYLCDINEVFQFCEARAMNVSQPLCNLFLASSFLETGGYPEKTVYGVQCGIDFVLLCQMLVKGPIAVYTAPICAARDHANQGCKRPDNAQSLYDLYVGFNLILQTPGLDTSTAKYVDNLLDMYIGGFICQGIRNILTGKYLFARHILEVFAATGLLYKPLRIIKGSWHYFTKKIYHKYRVALESKKYKNVLLLLL